MSKLLPSLVAGITLATSTCVPYESMPVPVEAAEYKTTPGEDFMGAEVDYQKLLDQNAPINVIFEPTDQPRKVAEDSLGVDQAQAERKYTEKLLKLDPAFVNETLDEVANANVGRYQPKSMSLVTTKELHVGNECIKSDATEITNRIRKLAEPLRQSGMLNIIYVDAEGCDISGFNNPKSVPITLADSVVGFGYVSEHERGHGNGLAHAGKKVCAKPVTMKLCRIEQVSDPGSIMSYTRKPPEFFPEKDTFQEPESTDATHFSTPELYKMGLLEDGEVLNNPSDGDYLISEVQKDGNDKETPKLIKVKTADSELFVSLEKDSQAGYDLQCQLYTIDSIRQLTQHPAKIQDFSVSKDGMPYFCYAIDTRKIDSSLQLREPYIESPKTKQEGFNLIARHVRGTKPEYPIDIADSSGEVDPGTIVYKDDTVTVTLVSLNAKDQAVVRISRTKKA